MGNKVTELEFDRRIAVHNKVVRIDSFKGVGVKINFRCLQHGEVHLAKPSSVLRGHGLICCNPTYIKNKRAKDEFDSKLNSLGRVRRIGEYTNMHEKILFYCLEHNETHLAFPRAVIRGQGLICCGSLREAVRKAKESFDSRIAKIGRVERIGEYIDCNTKILFRCLRHNEVHMSSPSSIIQGSGLICCRASGSDNLSDLITGKRESNGDTCLYAYNLCKHGGFIKIGISTNHEKRADPEYGDFISSWYTDSRLEAYCVEQASLRDVMLPRSCPEKLRSDKWPGYTEVIQCPEETAINVIQFYWDEMDLLGPYQFALDYLNPTVEETKLLRERLAMLD